MSWNMNAGLPANHLKVRPYAYPADAAMQVDLPPCILVTVLLMSRHNCLSGSPCINAQHIALPFGSSKLNITQ